MPLFRLVGQSRAVGSLDSQVLDDAPVGPLNFRQQRNLRRDLVRACQADDIGSFEIGASRRILEHRAGRQRGRNVESGAPLDAVADLRAIARPKARSWRDLCEQAKGVADRHRIAGDAGGAVGEGKTRWQQRTGEMHQGGRIDRVGKLRVGMLYRRAAADREPFRNPIGDVRVDVDGLDIRFDRLITPDPAAVVLRLEAERSADRQPEFQIGRGIIKTVNRRDGLSATSIATVPSADRLSRRCEPQPGEDP